MSAAIDVLNPRSQSTLPSLLQIPRSQTDRVADRLLVERIVPSLLGVC
jgi:hypothetical protein